MDYLVVIDMQNDFLTGSLKNINAEKLVPKIKNKIENFDGTVIYTQDTHFGDYLDTQEGRYLPVMHCIDGTEGHKIEPSLLIPKNGQTADDLIVIQKSSFGVIDNSLNIKGNVWRDLLGENPNSIELCGTVASKSLLSMAVILKSLYRDTPVIVCENLIADIDQRGLDSTIKLLTIDEFVVYKDPAYE